MISPFLYDTIKNKNFIKGEEINDFQYNYYNRNDGFLAALLYEIITMPTIVISEEDE